MKNIHLSCGHSVDSFKKTYSVILKSRDREGKKALSFSSICSSCKVKYLKSCELFESEEEALLWLTTDDI